MFIDDVKLKRLYKLNFLNKNVLIKLKFWERERESIWGLGFFVGFVLFIGLGLFCGFLGLGFFGFLFFFGGFWEVMFDNIINV